MRISIIVLCFIFSFSACTKKANKKIHQNDLLPLEIDIKDMQGNVVYHSDFKVALKSLSGKNKITSFNISKGEKIYSVVVNATAIVNSILNDVDNKSLLDKYNIKMNVDWLFQVKKANEKYYLCYGGVATLKEFNLGKKNELFENISNYLKKDYIPYRIARFKEGNQRIKQNNGGFL